MNGRFDVLVLRAGVSSHLAFSAEFLQALEAIRVLDRSMPSPFFELGHEPLRSRPLVKIVSA